MMVSSTRTAASITGRAEIQAHMLDHRVEPNHLGDVTRLLGHGLSERRVVFGDEVAVERLQLGLFGFTMRVAKLRPQRLPRGYERRQPADGRACQGRECRDIGRVQIALRGMLPPTIVKTPGALTLLHNSEGPLSIPNQQIESLQIMTNAALPLTVYSFLKEGEPVKVVRGPLAGCVGILDRVNAKRGRLVVNVSVFGKSVSVELDIEDVETVANSYF